MGNNTKRMKQNDSALMHQKRRNDFKTFVVYMLLIILFVSFILLW